MPKTQTLKPDLLVNQPEFGTITMRSRRNAAVLHLISAAIFARELKAVETTHAGEEFGSFWDDIWAKATAVVMTSVASVEAYANELFADRETLFPAVADALLRQIWQLGEKTTIQNKFELLAGVAGVEMDRSTASFRDLTLLIKLRNALVHFKPEWEDEKKEHAKLSQSLSSCLIPSPFLPNETLLPLAWASSTTASWAVETVLNFSANFESATGLPAKYQKFIDNGRFATG